MAHEVQGIEYCSGFLLPGMEPDNLAVQKWSGAEIPPDIHKAIAREGILNLAGAYG